MPPPWCYIEEDTRLRDARGTVIASVGYLDGRYIALHDPADAIRRYERDLKVLERHKTIEIGSQIRCYYEWANDDSGSEAWETCDEIRNLLDVYPEVGRD